MSYLLISSSDMLHDVFWARCKETLLSLWGSHLTLLICCFIYPSLKSNSKMENSSCSVLSKNASGNLQNHLVQKGTEGVMEIRHKKPLKSFFMRNPTLHIYPEYHNTTCCVHILQAPSYSASFDQSHTFTAAVTLFSATHFNYFQDQYYTVFSE